MAETIKKMSSILLPTVLAIFTAVALITSLPCVSAQVCGKQAAEAVCGGGWCCSQYGWCGVTHEYCGKGCQSQCGKLVATIITEDIFTQMLSHRDDRKCHANGFYTYAAFLAAASAFPGFGSTGNINTNRRELAAFLAQTSYETTAAWSSSPDDPYDHPYAWGYCFKEEQGITNDSCAPSSRWPCVSGKKYYGRGPIQIKWNYNYGAAGKAIGFDGLNNPDIVANDSTVSFKTAVWFWMTAQSPNPSCHDVMTGSSDSLAGRPAGYGLVTNIISHGIECGKGSDSRQEKRIGFYKQYCDVLGVSYGSNIDCNSHTTNSIPLA